MSDPLKNKLAALRAYSDSTKRRISMYSDLSQIDSKNATKPLGALTKAPAPGKKIQKIGFLMCWLPEPTGVTCAVGGPMILAGKFLEKKYNSATIHDIGNETAKAMSSISDFKKSIF